MNGTKPPVDRLRRKILVELLIIVSLVLGAVILESWLGPYLWLTAWAQEHQPWETQDLFFVLAVLAAGMAAFALRRWQDAKRELGRRREAERALRES